jgi:hypothetical protein
VESEIEDLGRDDIRDDIHNCNTAACVAGFTCLLFDYAKATDKSLEYDVKGEAMKLLDLTEQEAIGLFQAKTGANITGPEAAKVIRHLAETGFINWYQHDDE